MSLSLRIECSTQPLIPAKRRWRNNEIDAEIVAEIANQLLWLWIVKETETHTPTVSTAAATGATVGRREEMEGK